MSILHTWQVEGQDCEPAYEVLKVDSQTDRDRRNTSLSLNLQSASKVPPEPVQTPQDPEDESGKFESNVHDFWESDKKDRRVWRVKVIDRSRRVV